MDLDDLRREATSRGAVAKDLGGGHWQVCGDYLVNFYPGARRGPTVYVSGMASGRRFHGDVKKLVDWAFNPPGQPKRARRKRRYGNHKTRLFKADPRCAWCKKLLANKSEARLDHKIPLDQGGSNGYDNLVLACADCDRKKGNKMPHQTNIKRTQEGGDPPPDPEHSPGGGLPEVHVEPPTEVPDEQALLVAAAAQLDPIAREFTVVGYWVYSDQPFVDHQTAFTWEDAVCMARSGAGDTNHDQLIIVEVLAKNDIGKLAGQTGMETCVTGPVGRKLAAIGVLQELMGSIGDLQDEDIEPESLLADFLAETCDESFAPEALQAKFGAWLVQRVDPINSA